MIVGVYGVFCKIIVGVLLDEYYFNYEVIDFYYCY